MTFVMDIRQQIPQGVAISCNKECLRLIPPQNVMSDEQSPD